MAGCFNCEHSADYTLPGAPVSGLCETCWFDRHHNAAEDALLGVGLVTPRAAAELEAHFYDVTDAVEATTFAESMTALLDEIPRTTTLRLGTAEDRKWLKEMGLLGSDIDVSVGGQVDHSHDHALNDSTEEIIEDLSENLRA